MTKILARALAALLLTTISLAGLTPVGATAAEGTYTTEQPAANSGPAISGSVIAFYTTESVLRDDVTEDRDRDDVILAYYDISTGKATYTTEQPVISRPVYGQLFVSRTFTSPAISGPIIAFYADETTVKRDLNENGRKSEVILAYYDMSTGKATYTAEQPVREGSPSISGNIIAFSTSESNLDQDVNGDRDKSDVILAYYDISTGKATYTTEQPGANSGPAISGSVIAFYTTESVLRRDVNEDEDKNDTILAYYDISSGRATYTPEQPVDWARPSISDDIIVFFAHESPLDQDVNADGDKADVVLAYYDVATGKTTYTTEQPSFRSNPSISGGVIAFHTRESILDRDVNEDGDKNDQILAYYDILTKKVTYTPEQPVISVAVSEGVIAFYTTESSLRQDVNEDRDKNDLILSYIEIR